MGWLAAGVVVVVLPVAAVAAIAWRSFAPPRIRTPVPGAVSPWTTAAVSFPSAEGRTLHGWLVLPGTPRGIVVLVHGWGSDAGEMLQWSPFLAEAGWASLAFDMRGHGKTRPESAVVLPGLGDDVAAAVAFVTGRDDLAALPVAVLGHSMGGAAVLYALSRIDGDARWDRVRAAIISSAFARVETLTEYVLRKWLLPPALFRGLVLWVWRRRVDADLRAFEPETTVRAAARPLLLTHGTGDAVIPDRDMERLAAAAPEGALIQTIAGAGHTDLVDHPAYREGVLDFLERHLAGPPAAPKPLEPAP
jgi:alpha-beta hydrolase superfamily lysophospholipase